MNLVTIVFLVVAWGVVVAAQLMEGGSPLSLVSHPAPLVLVFGATLAVGLMGMRGQDFTRVWKAAARAFVPGAQPDLRLAYEQLVSFAEKARRDGLLALEAESKSVEDPFMRRSLELVIDGTDEDRVANILEADTAALQARHKVPYQFFMSMGGYAPTIGILGTVIGMMHVLESLDKPEAMGPAIAVAFLATLWGIGSANLIWIPLAAKMKSLTQAEVAFRGMVLDGILAIQAGSTPRQVGELLRSHLSPAQRADLDAAKPPRTPTAKAEQG